MSLQTGKTSTGSNAMRSILVTYAYMLLWIGLSATVILINKYILSYSHFPYPLSLTMTHMGFGSALAWLLVTLGFTEPVHMDWGTYLRCVVPIAGLFAGTLWLGNAAYLYLSVSFIQMIKASMPMCVYVVGIIFATEQLTTNTVINMAVIVTGIMIASYGELAFNLIGVLMQCSSLVTESTRLVLIQILLQKRGIKMNPITTLYYIAPACFAFLAGPWALMELPHMLRDESLVFNPWLLLFSAVAAFCLNLSVFLLIGKSSALTMNVAGVIKDWLLILLSVLLFGSPVTLTQYLGYGLSFLGVTYYNYMKFQASAAKTAAESGDASTTNGNGTLAHSSSADKDIEVPLLSIGTGNGMSNRASPIKA